MYKIRQSYKLLETLGIGYYRATRTKDNCWLLFYLSNGITSNQFAAVRAFCADARIMRVRAAYAPEHVKLCLAFPRAAYYRSITEKGDR
jgi:hypothetical protein